MESPHSISQASTGSRLARAALSLLLRPGRITKYTGRWKGHNTLLRLYRKYLPPDLKLRVGNFDGNLKFDVNMRGNLDICLWHFPELYEKEQRELFCSLIKPGCTVLGCRRAYWLLHSAGGKTRRSRVFRGSRSQQRRYAAAPRGNQRLQRPGHDFRNGGDRAPKRSGCTAMLTTRANRTSLREACPRGRFQAEPSIPSTCRPSTFAKWILKARSSWLCWEWNRTLERSPHIKLMVEYAQHLGAGEGLLELPARQFFFRAGH